MSFNGNKTGFFDTKNFRKDLLNKANARLGVIVKTIPEGNGTQVTKTSGMLSLLDSYYKSDVPSTNYSMHLKAIAYESSRALIISQIARDDIYFKSTRGEYLSQNIASFLFPLNRFPTTDKSDTESRNFYLSIIEAYFGGSTKANIEKSLLRFLEGVEVGIVENFLLARNGGSLDPVLNKFTFDILVNVNDERIRDINKLQADIEFLLSIIKPAHTTFETKLIFTEFFDVFRNICTFALDGDGNRIISPDGFEVKMKGTNTSICDTIHYDIFDYFYEDTRKPRSNNGITLISDEIIQEEDLSREIRSVYQASPRIPISIQGGNWSSSSENEFHTKYGPFAKENGSVADDVSDIIVTVDGVEVVVLDIFPLSGAFKLLNTPPPGSVVKVTYWVIRNYTGALITNDPDSVINNFRNSGTEHNYSTVLPPTGFIPEGSNPDLNVWEERSRYKGFDLFNSSVFNNPLTLNLNEPDSRSRINDYNVFKSHGYDDGEYLTTLREDTPLLPASLDLKDISRRLYSQQLILNNDEFLMNSKEDRMFGEIHQYSYHPFYSALEIESINNGGNKSILRTIDEDPVSGLQIEFQRALTEEIPHLGKDYDGQFYTFPTSLGYSISGYGSLAPAELIASGYASLTNDPSCIIFGGSGSWEVSDSPTSDYPSILSVDYPTVANIGYHFGGNHGQMHLLVNDVHLEDYTSLQVFDSLPYVEEEIKNIPYTNIFKLNSVERIEDKAFRLKEYGKPTSLTFQVNNSILSINPSANAIIPGSLSTVTSVKNNTKGFDYDINGMVLFGDKVIQLDESNVTNIGIGYSSGDEILVSYSAIDKMNDNHEIVRAIRNPVEVKFITQDSIYQLVSVYNNTKSQFYDINDYELIGTKIINLRKDSLINISIGFDKNDVIIVDYIKQNTVVETVTATSTPHNFLKIEIDSPNEMLEIATIKNLTKGQFYDLINIQVLNTNVVLLNDDSVRNILTGYHSGGDPIEDNTGNIIGYTSPDQLEVVMTSITGYSTITGEVSEVVESPYRFRFINVKPIDELISLTNVSLQQYYDLTDYGKIVASSGDATSKYALIDGTDTCSYLNSSKYWSSVGTNDSINETLSIKFNIPRNIDTITLVDHNWKTYRIQYIKDRVVTDFPTPIDVSYNNEDNTVHKFPEIEVTELIITIGTTIIAHEEKRLSKITYMLEDMIELDYTSADNHRMGLGYGDIIYSNSRSSLALNDIEPWITFPRIDYNRSVFEILPV